MKKTVITDERIDKSCERRLSELGYEIIKLPPSPRLAPPVASHPDMLIFMGKGRLVCEGGYFSAHSEIINRIAALGELEIVLAPEALSPEYPRDVLFNAAPVGDRLICRQGSVSESILALYPCRDRVSVKQGYAKCSCLTVGDGGVITADRSVAKGCIETGLDVLLLDSHGVALSGYDCGFIGGAGGDDGERILFCGSLEGHPEGKAIAEFCRRHHREPISLSEKGLYDYGTLMFV